MATGFVSLIGPQGDLTITQGQIDAIVNATNSSIEQTGLAETATQAAIDTNVNIGNAEGLRVVAENARSSSVKKYGALGDGITNDTAAFEAAEDALSADGGIIFIPEGTYIVAYRVRKANVIVCGTGSATILKTQSSATKLINDCPLRIFADNVHIKDICIDGNSEGNPQFNTMELAREADGIAIYGNYCTVENCVASNALGHQIIVWNDNFDDESYAAGARHHNSVRYNTIDGTNGRRNTMDFASTKSLGELLDTNINHDNEMIGNKVIGNIVVHTGWNTLVSGNIVSTSISCHTNSRRVLFRGNTCTGVGVQGGLTPDESSVARRSRGCVIDGNVITNSAASALSAWYADDITFINNKINGSATSGVNIKDVTNIIVEGNVFKACATGGIVGTLPFSNVFIKHNVFYHDEVVGSNYAIAVSAGIFADGNIIYGGARGIYGGGGSATNNALIGQSQYGFNVVGNGTIIEKNTISATGGYALYLTGDSTRIKDNDFSLSKYGLNVASTCAATEIIGNRFNLTGTKISSIKSDMIIRQNIGFVTENNGVETIASGQTSIAVTHGLSKTPALKDIMVTPNNSMGNASKFYVSDVGASTFLINVNADPGATTAIFAWLAQVR